MCTACSRCASPDRADRIGEWLGNRMRSRSDQMADNQKVIDRLNAELARKTDEVRIIQHISTEISATLDLERILAISLDAMETVLGFRHCMILLADTEERVLAVAASRGYDGGGTRAEIPVGQGVLGVAARRRRVVRIGNVGA